VARKLICLLAALVLAFATISIEPVAKGCGPYLEETIFTDMKAPDFDYGEFVQGRLGIVQPSYYDTFLFAAYRNLSGAPFTKDEGDTLKAALGANPAVATAGRERQAADPHQTSEEILWHAAAGETNWERKDYNDVQGVIRSESRDGNYIEYYNCLPDAFKTARERLLEHRQQFGADSPATSSWLEAQKQVFLNCGAPYQFNKPPRPAVIPVSAAESDPPIIRTDRKYQIAAAYFYAGDFDSAAARFSEIAKSEESPWHEVAGYLQARALIRKGTIADGKGNLDKDSLLQAEKLLKQIAADPKQSKIKNAARRRLDFLAARLYPEERRLELAAKLTRPGGSMDFDQDKIDYFWLLDRQGWTLGAKDDLTNWISAMKVKTPEAADEAIARWQKTKSLPWLVAALCKADASRPEVNELLIAAGKIPANSPAHTTLLFHSLRLRAKLAKDATSLAPEVDRVLAGEFGSMPISAQNQFLALRMSLAESFEEFLRFAPRTPAGFAYTFGGDEGDNSIASGLPAKDKPLDARFDADAAIVLSEKIPLRLLTAAGKNEKLPKNLRRLVTLAAWTRATVLKNDTIAEGLAPQVVEFAPELKPAMEPYLTAKTPEDRTFAAVYAILRSPGLRPFVDAGVGRETPTEQLDNLHENWWCSFAPHATGQAVPGTYFAYPWRNVPSSLAQIYQSAQIPALRFLVNEDSAAATEEFEHLTRLTPAPEWLGSEVLTFASSHPDDPRVPEALHLVVRATRFGCSTDGTGKVSKAAFDVLHKKYGESTWAQQTPYWFK
jgi:hypothetical protein